MATEAQIQANRANARRSTGPRTEAGKARSRLNGLKHGLRARSVEPVLPQEDPAGLQNRIDRWIEDYQPDSDIERDLVTRAATTSWAIDRARRCETALLSRGVRKALLGSRAKRVAEVCDLSRKLLHLAGRRTANGSGPGWSDDPAAFVVLLEESSEGAGWLLDRWEEIRCLIASGNPWTFLDQYKFVRLLGKQPFDAIDDPELNRIFLAWEVITEGGGVLFWKKMQEATPLEDPAFSAWRVWREITPRPLDAAAALAVLTAIVDRESERLASLLVDLEAVEGDDAQELAEQASFQAGDAAERLRRHQSVRTRELIKTIETLTKLRKESARPAPRKSAAAPPTSSPSPEPSNSTTEPKTPAAVEARNTTSSPSPTTPFPPQRSHSRAAGAPRLRVVSDDAIIPLLRAPRRTPSAPSKPAPETTKPPRARRSTKTP